MDSDVSVAVNLLNQCLILHHQLPWNKWIANDISCSVKHHVGTDVSGDSVLMIYCGSELTENGQWQ